MMAVQPVPSSASSSPAALTPSQLVILRLRATGMTNDAIATQLVVSPQTVRNHVQNAFKRLDVNDIVSALNALGWVKIR